MEIQNLSKRIDGNVVLKHINLSIPMGSIFGIVGRNGSGKTVLFKTIIDKSELTNPKTFKRKRFYNPILHYISEDTEMYGSFYHEKESKTPYWHCLDQVLVRKSLANTVNHVEYVKKIGTKDLLINAIPNEKISDHLPLLVNLQEVENGV